MSDAGQQGFLSRIKDRQQIITPIDSGLRFPEVVSAMRERYEPEIDYFSRLVEVAEDSAHLLALIRSPRLDKNRRMSLLKIFRRAVSGVCDTETTKKIREVSTDAIVEAYGHTFKPIGKLKEQFGDLTPENKAALALMLGEYDNRGQQGYMLTEQFFDWFEAHLGEFFTIDGPRGAGPDVELRSVVQDFIGSCPCDFVIRDRDTRRVLAVGFARYDSTRGGAQSDDRTGGNANKIALLRQFQRTSGKTIKVIFVSDGPGLTHKDTWREACELDSCWDDNVRVATLKLLKDRITPEWLRG